MADELSEEKRRVARLEQTIDSLRQSGSDEELTKAIAGAAERIGDVARRLNAER